MEQKYRVFVGQIIHTKSLKEFVLYTNGFVAVNEHGKVMSLLNKQPLLIITICILLQIVGVGENYNVWKASQTDYPSDAELITLSGEQFLMPGLIDCHIHAPQVAQIGLGLDMPLLEWLNTYTFPLEAKFADQEFAKKVYKRVVVSYVFHVI